MHYNDQAKTTPEAIPVEPTQPTNNTPPVVPGNYPNDQTSPTPNADKITQPLSDDSKEPETIETKEEEEQTPDWFMKDKFKTVEDQAKSYKELASKLGKFWGAPTEGYKVDGMEGIDANDPLIANLTPALKEMGLSQDGFQTLVNQYMSANKAMMGEMEAELKKTLTTTDAHTYQAITKWMDDSLTPEESTQIKNNWLMTADDFKLFNNLRLMLAPSTNVPTNNQNSVKYESSTEVTNEKIKYKKEVKSGSRVQDKNFENELASRFRDAAAREQRNKGR
jgi:hypothetical protein